jgi:hypothetical protein
VDDNNTKMSKVKKMKTNPENVEGRIIEMEIL